MKKYWEDLSPFVKYGCLKDEKFGDKMKDAVLFKDLEGKYLTANEYIKAQYGEAEDQADEKAGEKEAGESAAAAGEDKAPETEEKEKKIIYYVTDGRSRASTYACSVTMAWMRSCFRR